MCLVRVSIKSLDIRVKRKRREEGEDRRERERERLGVEVHGCVMVHTPGGAHSWWCTLMMVHTHGGAHAWYPKRKKMAWSQPTKISSNQGER